MIKNNKFQEKFAIWLALILTSLVYFVPPLLWDLFRNSTWFYISSAIFTMLFAVYFIIPFKFSKIKFSVKFSPADTFGYCLFIFTLCFLYYGIIEKICEYNNIKNSQYSIFQYLNSAYSEVNHKAASFPFSIINIIGIVTAFLVPALEEFFFRSYIQSSMQKHYGFWFSIIIPAFFVGIRHFSLFAINGQYFCPAAYFFAFSAFFSFGFFGYVYEAKNNLLPAIIVHFTGNMAFIACLSIFSSNISIG